MTDEGFKQNITVILSVNDGGWSHLMAEDRESTIRTLIANLTSLSFKLLNP
jgi:hypothetical protein